jgi:hypothetical protein
MNARRYFSPSYWASRFWARGSDTPPPVLIPIITVRFSVPLVRTARLDVPLVRVARLTMPIGSVDHAAAP